MFYSPADKNLPNSSNVEVEVTPPMNGSVGAEVISTYIVIATQPDRLGHVQHTPSSCLYIWIPKILILTNIIVFLWLLFQRLRRRRKMKTSLWAWHGQTQRENEQHTSSSSPSSFHCGWHWQMSAEMYDWVAFSIFTFEQLTYLMLFISRCT